MLTAREITICGVLTLLSLVTALALLAVCFNVIGFDEPIVMAMRHVR